MNAPEVERVITEFEAGISSCKGFVPNHRDQSPIVRKMTREHIQRSSIQRGAWLFDVLFKAII